MDIDIAQLTQQQQVPQQSKHRKSENSHDFMELVNGQKESPGESRFNNQTNAESSINENESRTNDQSVTNKDNEGQQAKAADLGSVPFTSEGLNDHTSALHQVGQPTAENPLSLKAAASEIEPTVPDPVQELGVPSNADSDFRPSMESDELAIPDVESMEFAFSDRQISHAQLANYREIPHSKATSEMQDLQLATHHLKQTSDFGLLATGIFDRWYEIESGTKAGLERGQTFAGAKNISVEHRSSQASVSSLNAEAQVETLLAAGAYRGTTGRTGSLQDKELTALASSMTVNEKIEKRKMSLVKQNDKSLKLIVRDYETDAENLEKLVNQLTEMNPEITTVVVNGEERSLAALQGEQNAS